MKYKIYIPDIVRIQLLLEVVNIPSFFLDPHSIHLKKQHHENGLIVQLSRVQTLATWEYKVKTSSLRLTESDGGVTTS
jgi:hypothetical protein